MKTFLPTAADATLRTDQAGHASDPVCVPADLRLPASRAVGPETEPLPQPA